MQRTTQGHSKKQPPLISSSSHHILNSRSIFHLNDFLHFSRIANLLSSNLGIVNLFNVTLISFFGKGCPSSIKNTSRMEQPSESSKEFASSFIDYMNESCTSFHAIEASAKILKAAGFLRIFENEEWLLESSGKYFFTRNETSLIAFTVGGAYTPGGAFTILGAHSDSPCLKIKPVACYKKGDALMLNTTPYGGGLWHTWFDRDLGLAGRIITEEDGIVRTKLVRIDRPVARIPNLAIHLTSGSERDSFAPNLQEHAKAILSMDSTFIDTTTECTDTAKNARLHPGLLHLIASESKVPIESIVDMELQLTDVQPSTLGGASDELIFSGRLDNLCSSYQIIRALADGSSESLDNQLNIRVAMMFDHEEVGSSSCSGAGSSMFMDTLRLISDNLTDGSHGKDKLIRQVID